MIRFFGNLRAPLLLCLGVFFLQVVKSDAQTFRGTILGPVATPRAVAVLAASK